MNFFLILILILIILIYLYLNIPFYNIIDKYLIAFYFLFILFVLFFIFEVDYNEFIEINFQPFFNDIYFFLDKFLIFIFKIKLKFSNFSFIFLV